MASLKTIGANGQIALGKKYAGRHVMIEEQGEGVWLIRTVRVVPDGDAPRPVTFADPMAAGVADALDHAIRMAQEGGAGRKPRA